MTTTIGAERREVQETVRNRSQLGFPFLAAVRSPGLVEPEYVARCDMPAAMRLAVMRSGMDDHEVAAVCAISKGYMSKVLAGAAGLWGPRLVAFMRATGSLAPLQWMADQMGCDVVQRDSRAAEVAALKARLQELEKAA